MITDFSDIYKDMKKEFQKEGGKIVDKAFKKLKELTPEDTFLLQKDNMKSDLISQGGELKARLYNESEYVGYVEFSIIPKNYYKNSGRRKGSSPFNSGKGAGMFRKTEDYINNEL